MALKPSTTRVVAIIVVVGMLLSAVVAAVVSFYASSQPDGLERVVRDTGFAESAAESANADSPLAGYGIEGVENARASAAGAGLVGVAVTAAVGFGLFAWLKPRKPSSET
jgi:hypothetical protein